MTWLAGMYADAMVKCVRCGTMQKPERIRGDVCSDASWCDAAQAEKTVQQMHAVIHSIQAPLIHNTLSVMARRMMRQHYASLYHRDEPTTADEELSAFHGFELVPVGVAGFIEAARQLPKLPRAVPVQDRGQLAPTPDTEPYHAWAARTTDVGYDPEYSKQWGEAKRLGDEGDVQSQRKAEQDRLMREAKLKAEGMLLEENRELKKKIQELEKRLQG